MILRGYGTHHGAAFSRGSDEKRSHIRANLLCRVRFVRLFRSILWWIALLSVSIPARALMLGEMEPLSALGQPFRARVGFQRAPDESIDASCVRVHAARPEPQADVPVLLGVRAHVESIAGKDYIFLKSTESLSEPILLMDVKVDCVKAGSVTRKYVLLPDPPVHLAEVAPTPTKSVVQPPPAVVRAHQADSAATAPIATSGDGPPVAAATAPVAATAGAAPPEQAKRSPARASARKAGKPKARGTRDVLRLAPTMDVLRVAPTMSESDTSSGAPEFGWRLRLSYELSEREGAPISEADREKLRREFAERMAEGDVVPRLLALRDEVRTLKRQVAGLIAERLAAETRRKSEAQSERYAWIISLILGTVALGAVGWLWIRRPRREPFSVNSLDLFDTSGRDPAPPSSTEKGELPDAEGLVPVVAPATHRHEPEPATASPAPLFSASADAAPTANAFEDRPIELTHRIVVPPAEKPIAAAQADDNRTVGKMAELAFERSVPSRQRRHEATALSQSDVADRLSLDRNVPGEEAAKETTAPDFELAIDSAGFNPCAEEISAHGIDLILDSVPAERPDLRFELRPEQAAESVHGQSDGNGSLSGPSEVEYVRAREAELVSAIDFGRVLAEPGTSGTRSETAPAVSTNTGHDADRALQYRNAFIAERFPEIAAGSIALDNPATAVEGARIMYQEDLDVSRAVGLLQLAWSMHPQHVGLWLGLFEIYWLEGMQLEYLDLASRFREVFSSEHEQWPMIAKLGRGLDATSALFRAEGLPAVGDEAPNWLNAQLDMMGHVLSGELRAQVLERSDASDRKKGA